MRILTLDPAVCTGWCITEITGDVAEIVAYGDFVIESESDYMGDRCLLMMNRVLSMIGVYNIDEVTVEDYFFSRLSANGSNVNAAFRTAIHMACRQKFIPYEILNISLWKKWVAGRAKPTKEQKLQWGKAKANKYFIQLALYEKYGIRFTNHSISPKTGKPIQPKNDVVDAVAMAIFYVGLYKNIPAKVEIFWLIQ